MKQITWRGVGTARVGIVRQMAIVTKLAVSMTAMMINDIEDGGVEDFAKHTR